MYVKRVENYLTYTRWHYFHQLHIQYTINRPFVQDHHLVNFHHPFDMLLMRSPRGTVGGWSVRGWKENEKRGEDESGNKGSEWYVVWCAGSDVGTSTPWDLRDVNEITRELVSDITSKLCPLSRPRDRVYMCMYNVYMHVKLVYVYKHDNTTLESSQNTLSCMCIFNIFFFFFVFLRLIFQML